jgi:hypothetical protein
MNTNNVKGSMNPVMCFSDITMVWTKAMTNMNVLYCTVPQTWRHQRSYAELASSSDNSPSSANEAQDCTATALGKDEAKDTSDEELEEDVLRKKSGWENWRRVTEETKVDEEQALQTPALRASAAKGKSKNVATAAGASGVPHFQ